MVGGVFDLIRPLTISLTQCPEAIRHQGFWVRSLVGMKPAGLFRDPTSAESTGLGCQHLQLDKSCGFSKPENPCL